jgi:hypothetical protein
MKGGLELEDWSSGVLEVNNNYKAADSDSLLRSITPLLQFSSTPTPIL